MQEKQLDREIAFTLAKPRSRPRKYTQDVLTGGQRRPVCGSTARSLKRVRVLPLHALRDLDDLAAELVRDYHLAIGTPMKKASSRKRSAQLDREIREHLAKAKPRRRGQAAHATIKNRDDISSHVVRVLGDQLDDAADRAVAAGAQGVLEFQGAGMSGIVFCDEKGTAYKVAREGGESTVAEETEWLQKAGQIPGVREHVAKGARYDKKNRVLVRECVQGKTGTSRNTSKLFDLHKDIRKAMRPYGWLSPEFKEDSYVYARGRGPVLVDASMAIRVGGELVKYAQDVLENRRTTRERLSDIAFAIRSERGSTIPEAVADKLLAKLKARGVDTDF